jgi:hypothetical protein
MGIQSICKVKAKVSPVKPDGTNDPELVVPYYFRGSNVYKASTGIATASLIEHIPADKWEGTMPLTPVADLIRAGILSRVNITVQNANKKKFNYQLVVDSEQLPLIYDSTGAGTLDNLDYILTKGTTTDNKGKITKISSRTEAYNP